MIFDFTGVFEMKKFLKHINLLNILLFSIVLVLVSYVLVPLTNFKVSIYLSERKSGHEKPKEAAVMTTNTPSSTDYVIISDLNLFHPERIIPPEKKTEQLPKPEIVLYGTLITHDTQIAYLDDLKAPYSTSGRGTRQRSLRLGQVISGYTLKEIHHDKILIAKGDDVIEVRMLAKKRSQFTETASTEASTSQTSSQSLIPAPSRVKTGGQPPGVVLTGPPQAGAPSPDAFIKMKDTIEPVIRKNLLDRTEGFNR